MKRILLALITLLLLTRPAFAAGSVVVTTSEFDTGNRTHIYEKYSVAWTSTAGGAVSGNAFTIVAGAIVSVRFIPGGTTPSDLYDVTLAETSGNSDLLLGQGADRSNANSSILAFDPPFVQDGSRTIDVVVANAGNAKTGTVVILVQIR